MLRWVSSGIGRRASPAPSPVRRLRMKRQCGVQLTRLALRGAEVLEIDRAVDRVEPGPCEPVCVADVVEPCCCHHEVGDVCLSSQPLGERLPLGRAATAFPGRTGAREPVVSHARSSTCPQSCRTSHRTLVPVLPMDAIPLRLSGLNDRSGPELQIQPTLSATRMSIRLAPRPIRLPTPTFGSACGVPLP